MTETATGLRSRGAFVEIAKDVWVNAAHVAAIVPIDGIKAGTPLQQCRVYVAGPSLGGGHVLAWNSEVSAWEMVLALDDALDVASRDRGYEEERGRIDALNAAGDDDD